jgi:hypothetical protein
MPDPEPPTAIPFATAGVLVGILVLGLAVSRLGALPALRIVLVLQLAIAAAESAVHGLHHLDNPDGAENCQVLTVSQQLHGEPAPEQPRLVPLAVLATATMPVVLDEVTRPLRRPDMGRAPPPPLT